MYLKLAWRNIWRNKRRTLITSASIFFAVILAVLMRSGQYGVYEKSIDNMVGYYTGYLQIHKKGYWNDQTIDNAFAQDSSIYHILRNNSMITSYAPRLESFALASSQDVTKGTMVVGIDPQKESQLTHLDKKVVAGKYLNANDNALLVAEGLAKQLKLHVNDTLVLLGQGFHGVTAAGKYYVKGLLHFGSPELNKSLVYLPLKQAQSMYGTGNMLTSIAIMIRNSGEDKTVLKSLHKSLNGKQYEVMDWKTLLPDLVQVIEADSSGGLIMIAVLYMVIAFGIFGTILMMTAERRYEFGVLIAIGMKRLKLATVVSLEILLMAILGVITGALGSIPIVMYFYHHPIRFTGKLAKAYTSFGFEPVFAFSRDPSIFYNQGLVVFIICIILIIYPIQKIIKSNVIDSMHG